MEFQKINIIIQDLTHIIYIYMLLTDKLNILFLRSK